MYLLEKEILGTSMIAISFATIHGLYPGCRATPVAVSLVPPVNSILEPRTAVMEATMLLPSFWQWAAVKIRVSEMTVPPHTELRMALIVRINPA